MSRKTTKIFSQDEIEVFQLTDIKDCIPINILKWFENSPGSDKGNHLLRYWIFCCYFDLASTYSQPEFLRAIVPAVFSGDKLPDEPVDFFKLCSPPIKLSNHAKLMISKFSFCATAFLCEGLGPMEKGFVKYFPEKPFTAPNQLNFLKAIGYSIEENRIVMLDEEDEIFSPKSNVTQPPKDQEEQQSAQTSTKINRKSIEKPSDTNLLKPAVIVVENKNEFSEMKSSISEIEKEIINNPDLFYRDKVDSYSSGSSDDDGTGIINHSVCLKRKIVELNDRHKEILETIEKYETLASKLKIRTPNIDNINLLCEKTEFICYDLGPETTEILLNTIVPEMPKNLGYDEFEDQAVTAINNWALAKILSSGLFSSNLLPPNSSKDPVKRIEKMVKSISEIPNQFNDDVKILNKSVNSMMDMMKSITTTEFQTNVILRKDPTSGMLSDDKPSISTSLETVQKSSHDPVPGGEPLRISPNSYKINWGGKIYTTTPDSTLMKQYLTTFKQTIK